MEDEQRRFAGHSVFSIKTDDRGKRYCSHYTRFVEPRFRRQGIGEMLLLEAEACARQMGAEYMKRGFVRTGPVQGPYPRYDLRKDLR